MTQSPKPRLASVIDGTTRTNVKFVPPKDFYDDVGIGRKRFGQIYRGDKSPSLDEARAIAQYFKVSIHDLID